MAKKSKGLAGAKGRIAKKAVRIIETPIENVKLWDVGKYGTLKKSGGRDGMQMDHIPSKAARVKHAENVLGRKLTDREKRIIMNEAGAVAVTEEDHRGISRTFGPRNTPEQIAADADDLKGAIDRDLEVYKDRLKADGVSEKELKKALNDLLQPDKLTKEYYEELFAEPEKNESEKKKKSK